MLLFLNKINLPVDNRQAKIVTISYDKKLQ